MARSTTPAAPPGLARRLFAGLGRHATWILAVGIFLGVALPDLAAAARPLLTPAILALLTVTLLRLDLDAVRRAFARPVLVLLAVAWVMVGLPLLAWPVLQAVPFDPLVAAHLLLTAATAPIISGAAVALLLGLDAAFVLAVGSLATLTVPFTLPLLATGLLGLDLPLDPVALWLRLLLLIGGASGAAALIRRALGGERLRREGPLLDGVAVTAMLLFGVAVMDGVTRTLLNDPGFVLACALGTFGLAGAAMVVGTLAFLPFGRSTALAVGLLSAFGNFGVVVAAMGAAAPAATVVYLGVAQFPIYVLPVVLKPLVLHMLGARRPKP